jgi:hypothetical protein
MGTRNDLFEIYMQFGHVPSKTFDGPALHKATSFFTYRYS